MSSSKAGEKDLNSSMVISSIARPFVDTVKDDLADDLMTVTEWDPFGNQIVSCIGSVHITYFAALSMLSFFTSIVRIISRKIFSEAFSVSAHRILGSCLPASPCYMPEADLCRWSKGLSDHRIHGPDLPRISSAISGFFFCGMMLLPVEKESSISTKRIPQNSTGSALRRTGTDASSLQRSS